jgi:molybdenum cofactor biosynthesis protein B
MAYHKAVSVEEHRSEGARQGAARIAVVTVSDTRTEATDENGVFLKAALAEAGHVLELYALVPDEPARVLTALDDALSAGARVVLFNGGTGIAARDTTFEALSGRIERPIPGFGELFRMLSYEQVGAAAMLSRATAGVIGRAVIFAMPGSNKAVRLAWERLIAPELVHIIWELDR